MAILECGLETTEYNVQGHSTIVTNNMEILNNRLKNIILTNQIAGVPTIENISTTQDDPDAQTSDLLTDSSGGTSSTTIKTISGSGADSDINDNFASLANMINKIVEDMEKLYPAINETIDYCDSIKSKVNDILSKLRKTTGTGILGG